jgi:hypothetical protein
VTCSPQKCSFITLCSLFECRSKMNKSVGALKPSIPQFSSVSSSQDKQLRGLIHRSFHNLLALTAVDTSHQGAAGPITFAVDFFARIVASVTICFILNPMPISGPRDALCANEVRNRVAGTQTRPRTHQQVSQCRARRRRPHSDPKRLNNLNGLCNEVPTTQTRSKTHQRTNRGDAQDPVEVP